MSVSDLMEIGRQGIMANREGMKTSANNVANSNNPEYSRQRTAFTSNEPVIHHGARIGGGGVKVKETIRVHDEFIQKQLFENARFYGSAKVRSEMTDHIEKMLHGGSTAINERMHKFFNDVRELSANPEMSTHRYAVKESAKSLATSFNHVSHMMEGVKDDIDFKLSSSVDDVNKWAKELAHLNGIIAGLSAARTVPNEMFDKQEAVIEKLTQKLGYQVERQQNGTVNLVVPGAGVLVQGATAAEFAVSRETEKSALEPSRIQLYLKDPGTGRLIRAKNFEEGEIGGLLHVREKVIKPIMKHVDEVVYKFTQNVNEVHRDGRALNGEGGLNLFEDVKKPQGSASMIRINDEIDKNSENLAVGLDRDAPGDNRVALEISKLQDTKLLPSIEGPDLGTDPVHTIGESLNTLITNIGSETASQRQDFEHQSAIHDQLVNQKDAVSGVSLEEEAIAMIQHQAAYNAAARTMSLGDELLETLIKIV